MKKVKKMMKMKLKNKNRSIMLLRSLLMVFFSAMGHKLCNMYAWDQIKDNLKFGLQNYKSTFIDAGRGTVYPNPDEANGGDRAGGNHLKVDYCNNTAISRAAKVNPNPVVGQLITELGAYYMTAPLHYVQDMATPVHNPPVWNDFPNSYGAKPNYFFGDNKDNTTLHGLYESPGSYGISCSSSSCGSFGDVLGKIPAAETRLTGISGIGSNNGSVFTGTAFKEHLANRLKGWYPILNSGNVTNIKNRLLEDIAFACCVQKRFWKGNINLKNWFK